MIMGKEQNKKKDSEKFQRKNSGLKIIICIVVGILILLAVIICIICGVNACIQGEPIKMGDWLMAGCALLSMFGTVILACVSVVQSDRANKLNERLIKQNEELQKINDTQFKIVNQNMFPTLAIRNIMMKEIFDSTTSNFLINWENNFLKLERTNGNMFSSFSVDCRLDRKVNEHDLLKITFDLVNDGDTKVHDIAIYKINITDPINNSADVKWPIEFGILNPGESTDVEIFLAHNIHCLLAKCQPMKITLFLRMKNLMGLTFYENLNILIKFRDVCSKINEISLSKLTGNNYEI